ncbi:hypothetical protein DPMN_064513 [Dreissena polymorpha]|uniref:Uncharacterized protein n=1 Tax=Dreissena polymorpha TaxID=45954 RepID=A0A9D4CDB4_DREPO|nr:hypothetical protein DPMN_064513 [Dreissena polymorpha]
MAELLTVAHNKPEWQIIVVSSTVICPSLPGWSRNDDGDDAGGDDGDDDDDEDVDHDNDGISLLKK